MKTIKVDNKKIKESLTKKETYVTRVKEISAKMQELEKEYNELVAKISRTDEKARPHIDKENKKIEKGEFEQLSRVYLDKGELVFEVADRLEEFKLNYKNAIDKQKKEGKK